MCLMSATSPGTSWRDRLEDVGGRRRDQLVVGCVVAAVVFCGVAVWARGAPPRIAPPARAGQPTAHESPSASGAVVLIHVAGAVHEPGVFELPPGARVADAIELAGGPLRRADLDALNLAAPVVDGAQILVPARGAASAPATTAAAPSQGAAVSINSADQALLETIPGIGPVTATAILEHRDSIGSFESLDQLLDVTGIGPATLESMRPYVTL